MDNAYLQPGLGTYTFTPVNGEAEADGDLGVQGQPGLYNETLSQTICSSWLCSLPGMHKAWNLIH